MQESFSIIENWDSASSNKAVGRAISHVITNIHKHMKSIGRQPKCETRWGQEQRRVFLNRFLIEHHVLQVKHKEKKTCTLTCGRSSPLWSPQSVVYRSSLAASGQFSTPVRVPIRNTYTQHKPDEYWCETGTFWRPVWEFRNIQDKYNTNKCFSWKYCVCVSVYLTCVSVLGFQSGS